MNQLLVLNSVMISKMCLILIKCRSLYPKDETTVHDSLNFKEDFNNVTKQGVLKVNEDNESF